MTMYYTRNVVKEISRVNTIISRAKCVIIAKTSFDCQKGQIKYLEVACRWWREMRSSRSRQDPASRILRESVIRTQIQLQTARRRASRRPYNSAGACADAPCHMTMSPFRHHSRNFDSQSTLCIHYHQSSTRRSYRSSDPATSGPFTLPPATSMNSPNRSFIGGWWYLRCAKLKRS